MSDADLDLSFLTEDDKQFLDYYSETNDQYLRIDRGYFIRWRKRMYKLEAVAVEFDRHLTVMESINKHLGYKFTQPLVLARDSLKALEEK